MSYKITPAIRNGLFALLAFALFLFCMGESCDTDTEEAVGVRVNDNTGKVQLTTNEGWTDAEEFAGQAVEDTKDDLANIAKGIEDGANAIADQGKQYANPVSGGTCADQCNLSRKICRDRNEKFDSCRCRCY